MARVRMYHAGGDRYQHASAAAFEDFHQHEGWVLADDDEAPAPVVEPEPVSAEGESAVPPAEAPEPEAPKRGRRA